MFEKQDYHGIVYITDTERFTALRRSLFCCESVQRRSLEKSGNNSVDIWSNILYGAPWPQRYRWYEQTHLNTGNEYYPWPWADCELTVNAPIVWAKI